MAVASASSKFHISNITTKNGEREGIINQKSKGQIEIKESEEINDLGVTIDTNLEFQKKIATSVRKSNGVFASIKRTIKYLDIETFTIRDIRNVSSVFVMLTIKLKI